MLEFDTKKDTMIVCATSIICLVCCIFTIGCLVANVGSILRIICIVFATMQVIAYFAMSVHYLNEYNKIQEEWQIREIRRAVWDYNKHYSKKDD